MHASLQMVKTDKGTARITRCGKTENKKALLHFLYSE